MIANKWYCIAQSGTFDSGCIVDVSFDGYSIQFSVGIRYGSSAINITSCNLPSSINLSARLRQTESQWSLDLLSDKDISTNVVVAGSPFWVAVNSEAGAGDIILSLTNISKEFNTESGGSGSGGGFDEDMLRKFLEDNGYTALLDFWKWEETAGGSIRTKYNIIVEKGGAFGSASPGGESSGGGLGTVILRTPSNQEYISDENGVVSIPNWVTSDRLNGFATESWVLQKNYLTRSTADALYASQDEVDELKGMWSIKDGKLYTSYSIVVEGGGAFGQGAAEGDTPAISNVTIYFNGSSIPYKTNEAGVITLPAYPTALKNPHALKINGVTYDGSKDITINLEGGGGIADSVAWENVQGRPTALSEFENDVPYLTEQKASDTYITKASLEDMWYIDENGSLHTRYNLVVDGGGAFGQGATPGGGTSGGIGKVTLKTPSNIAYDSDGNGVVLIPEWSTQFWVESKGYATQTWVNDAYLSKSGGTIIGSYDALKIKRNNAYASLIKFENTSGAMGYLGFNSANIPIMYTADAITPYTLLHENNYSSYALPLTGGRINGILRLQRDEEQNYIVFDGPNNTTRGYLGFAGDNNPIYIPKEANVIYPLLHSGNYSSYALPLSGVASQLDYTSSNPLLVNTTASSNMLTLKIGGVSYTQVGYYNGLGSILYSAISDKYLGIKDDGTPTYNGNTLIHSGNIGSYNAGSATKLQTARTIWGQSFDGTGNVSGSISYVSQIDFSNNANTGTGGLLRFFYKGSSSYTSSIYERALGQLKINDALYVNNGGNVLIGATEDNGNKLQINGGISATGYIRLDRYYGANEYFQLETEDVNINYRAYDTDGWCSHNFYSNDNLLVRIDGYAGKLDVNGNLVVTGGGAFGSDVRYKNIINYTNIDLATIADAPLFTYKWNDREDNKVYLGTSAQYWLDTVFTNAVNTDNPNFYHLDYGALAVGIGISVAKEVKGVKTEVEQLREEVKQLKEKLNKYETLWHN